MNLPRKVREIGKAADRAEKELEEQRRQAAGDGAQPANDPPATGEQPTPPGQPQDEGSGVDWEAEAKAALEKVEAAEARYRTLKGKYDAEVPELRRENRDLSQRIEALEAKVNAAPSAPGADDDDIDDDEFNDQYGEDLLKKIRSEAARAAREASAAATDGLSKKVDHIEGQARESAADRFFGAINEAHPDWRQVNKLEAWKRFCAEDIEGTGLTRQDAIERAQEAGDPTPIIKQLDAFKERAKPGRGTSDRVVPEDGGGSEPGESADTASYKESTVQKFYTDVATGRFKGDAKERARLDALYTKAVKEGRVIPGQ